MEAVGSIKQAWS